MEPCLTVNSNCTCSGPPPTFNVTHPPNFCRPTTTASPTTEEVSTTVSSTIISTITSTVTSTVSDIISTIIETSTSSPSNITQAPPTSPHTGIATTGHHTSTSEPIEPTLYTTEPNEKGLTTGEIVGICFGPIIVIIIVIIIMWCKKRNSKAEIIPPTLQPQSSTIGLIGTDEPDKGGNTNSKEKEAISYKDEINNGIENKELSEDDSKKEEKPAPVVQMTEL